jgi:spermidine synthase
MDRIIVFLMGFQAVLLQMTLLRELLTVFSGNELDVGITLAVWLLSVGAGSFAGRSLKHPGTLTFLLIGVMLLGHPTLTVVHLIRSAAGAGFGEVLSFPVTLGATLLVLSPICVLLGMLYPQAVAWLGGQAALAYGLEAGGSFLGGALYSFIFAGEVTPSTTISIVGILCGISALISTYSIKVDKNYRILAVISLIVVLIYPIKSTNEGKVVNSFNSRYGRIDIVNIRNQKSLFSSGRFIFSYPDAQAEEMTAHLPIILHPLPSRVLVVGGSPGVVREMLKYPRMTIDHVEIDPEILHRSIELLSPEDRDILRSDRMFFINEDARKYVKRAGAGAYDLIVMNLPEPVTANINRLYTVEFFQEVRRTLRDGGVMVLSLPPSFGYTGRQLQLANGTIFASLRTVFTHVEPSSEEYGILAASDGRWDQPSRLRESVLICAKSARTFSRPASEEVFDPRRWKRSAPGDPRRSPGQSPVATSITSWSGGNAGGP